LCLEGIESEPLLFLLDKEDVCASAASACASGAMEPSHVLAAMGVEAERAKGALRLSLGHTTTQNDIDRAVVAVTNAVEYLHEMKERTRARAQSATPSVTRHSSESDHLGVEAR